MRCFNFLLLLVARASALTSAQWRSQSIYHVVTDRFALTNGSTTQLCGWGNYCGGTWRGIVNKLDYIKGMGYTAVWISPIVKNIPNSIYGYPYHGYWAQDLYQLNPAFGTEADLKALSDALHSKGMYLMVDVVANHLAYSGDPSTVNYSSFNPFNSQKYFHPYCPIDYSNAESVTKCWMGDTKVPLPDLKVEDAAIQDFLNSWISQLVHKFNIDGLRLDSAMQTTREFWPGFVSASGVYAIGEVLNGSPNDLCPWQSYIPGVINYPAYYWIVRAFESVSSTMTELANNIQWLSSVCSDVTLMGNFLENHDNPRFPSITTDASLTRNAIAFTTLSDGIPILYYGQEQGFSGAVDPYNREPLWMSAYNTKSPLYSFIASLNAARNMAIAKDPTYVTSKMAVVYSDSKSMVTRKGAKDSPLFSLFSDHGAAGGGTVTLTNAKAGITANTRYTDLLTCEVVTSDASGNLAVSITNGLPRALYRSSSLSGNDPCAYTSTGSADKLSPSSVVLKISLSSKASEVTTVKPQTTTTSSSKPGPTSPASPPKIQTSKTAGTTAQKSTTANTATRMLSLCSTVDVSFHLNVTTAWLESIDVVGSILELGDWDPSKAISMSAAGYTSVHPVWDATVKIPAGTFFEYKFIKIGADGGVTWEADPNRHYTAPENCSTTAGLFTNWQM